MAFMMPVMKNNYEIYPRSRKNSESVTVDGRPTSTTTSLSAAARRRSSGPVIGGLRRPASRTVSESERSQNLSCGSGRPSESGHFLSASPPLSSAVYSSSAPAGAAAFAHHNHQSRLATSYPTSSAPRAVRFIRSASQENGQAAQSPSRKSSSASCRSVASSTSSTTATSSASNEDPMQQEVAQSPRLFGSGAFGKFHSKLVDKLKRKLKIKDADGGLADEDEDQTAAIRSST